MENIQKKEDYSAGFEVRDIELKNINGTPYFIVPMNGNIDGTRSLPQFDINIDYETECEHLKSINEELVKCIEKVGDEIKEIKITITDIEKNKVQLHPKKYKITKKRDRRKSNEISRNFTCELCEKTYG